MKICVKETSRGRVLWLSDDHAEVGLALDYGLRIIHMSCPGMENLFYEQPADLSDGFTTEEGWKLYGGHRLWMSPESHLSNCPDNDPVTYTQDGDSVLVQQNTEPWLGIRKALRITFLEGKVQVDNIIENASDHEIEGASWGVNTLAGGGTARVDFPNYGVGDCRPHRVVSLWGPTDLHDERIRFTADSLTAVHAPLKQYFKLGLYCHTGVATYENKGQRFTLTFAAPPLAQLPDLGCNFELYMCSQFMELESLGITHTLQPGESMTHTEYWQLEKL